MLVGMKPTAPASEGRANFVGFFPIGKYDKWCTWHGLARAFDQGLLLRIFNRGAAKAENDHRTTSGLGTFQLG